MSPPVSSFHLIMTCVLIPFLLLLVHFPLTSPQLLKGCGFSALYNFGDSLSDTGNALVQFDFGGNGKYPYGMTIGKPTGRFSDGLLLIDRIAESAGLPHCNPYLRKDMDHSKGVNFAVAGVSVLSKAQRDKFGLHLIYSQSSLDVQLQWFVNFSREAFHNESARKANFESALFVLGGGGNDYGGFKNTPEEKMTLIPYVIAALKEGLKTVISHGARRIVVMGVYQGGCLPGFNKTILERDQGPIVCDKEWNSYLDLHNKHVQKLVLELGKEYPQVHLAYGNMWDGIQWMFDNFRSLGLHISYARCCGTEEHKVCGETGTPFCKDPYHYIWWDNLHFTDRAYKLIASKVIPWMYRDLQCATYNFTSFRSGGVRVVDSIHQHLWFSFAVMMVIFLFLFYEI